MHAIWVEIPQVPSVPDPPNPRDRRTAPKENPELLSDGLSLPAFVDRNPQARARVMAQLARVVATAQSSAAQ